MQPLHRSIEIARNCEGKHLHGARDGLQDGFFIRTGGTTKDPTGDLIAKSRMAYSDAKTMKAIVAELGDDVANAVLASMAAPELEARRSGRQIQVVMHYQAFLSFDLPEIQCPDDRPATGIHER